METVPVTEMVFFCSTKQWKMSTNWVINKFNQNLFSN